MRDVRGNRSYAVTWREDGDVVVGRLDLSAHGVRLEGSAGRAHETSRILRYGEIDSVRAVRLGGRRVLELEAGVRRVRIGSLDRAGSLAELARELLERAAKPQPGSGVAPMTGRA